MLADTDTDTERRPAAGGAVRPPRGELFGDPVGGQPFALVIHQQIEPGVLR
jgi:hypothetical protein